MLLNSKGKGAFQTSPLGKIISQKLTPTSKSVKQCLIASSLLLRRMLCNADSTGKLYLAKQLFSNTFITLQLS